MNRGDGEENSDMEISDGDGDHEIIDCHTIDEMKCWVEEQEMKYHPPLYSDDYDEVDISDACLVFIDGPKLKKKSEDEYSELLKFWFHCLRKNSLPVFSHPGQPLLEGGVISQEGSAVSTCKFYSKLARKAVTTYNKLIKIKEKKLKFQEVVKVNSFFCCVEKYFMTFSAINMDTGKSGLYQAALIQHFRGYVLGLLRECSTDKILAIIWITGAEEELAANRKMFEQFKADSEKED